MTRRKRLAIQYQQRNRGNGTVARPQQLPLPFKPRPPDAATAARLYGGASTLSYCSGFSIAFLQGGR